MSKPEPPVMFEVQEGRTDRFHPWTRLALQAIMLVLFTGLVIAVLGVAAAIVHWAWTT